MGYRRTLLKIPIINILYFAFAPKTAYTEYLLWIMEEHNITMEQLWEKLSPTERKTLEGYGMTMGVETKDISQPTAENISTYNN